MDIFKTSLAWAVGKTFIVGGREAEILHNTFYNHFYEVLEMEYFTTSLYFETLLYFKIAVKGGQK